MASTDKLRKASGSTRPVVTTLSLPKAAGATTADLTSATGWNTTTGTDVVIYRRQLNTTTGLYEKVDGTQTDWTAQLTGTTLSGMVLQAGTEPASGYAADGNTVVLAGPTAQWSDDLIETLLTLFNQDQSLKSAPIQTALGLGAGSLNGWNALGYAPNTVTANGNRSYDLVFNGQDLTSTLSAGMRLRTTRTVAAPTQCTSLNGSTQYYSKSSPAGMTFTDDFVVGAWVKLSSYPATAGSIMSRYNGTSGWDLQITSTGQVYLVGYNGGSANSSDVHSYQSIPLNKWVHIAVQTDMSTFTASTTTSYIMIDGVDVPAAVGRAGTNPTALVQAGNLEIGSRNAGTNLFPGKIAQAFVSSAKIIQLTIRTLISQGLTSALVTANSIVSTYSFNASTSDINTTNSNNLTANGSAVATNADSPFGVQADGTNSTTLDYAIIQKASFATNTTLTLQVPEGGTIPTSGGVASVVYSSAGKPYGMPGDKTKYTVQSLYRVSQSAVMGTSYTNVGSAQLTIPVGAWKLAYKGSAVMLTANSVVFSALAAANNTGTPLNSRLAADSYNSASGLYSSHSADDSYASTTATVAYLNVATNSAGAGAGWDGTNTTPLYIEAECANV